MNPHKSPDNKDTENLYISSGTTQIDPELEKQIKNRVMKKKGETIVVSTGITSSHLGDERNLREFMYASEVVRYLRLKNFNVLFLLIDDSYDPLNFQQLRVGVNKDETLIKKFEKYCGMPLVFIPDPYTCHTNYSAHFQEKILERFHTVGIFPNILDTYSAYESGAYDFAKEIVFTHYKEIQKFLKKKFPSYTMKKIFYPVCPDCRKMDGADAIEIEGAKIKIYCHYCKKSTLHLWKQIKGKFSWKVDEAIKWNLYKTDFEPFSKAYLDPTVGSFIIAKVLSEEYFGGNTPDVIQYGQVIMDKSFSYTLLNSLPLPAFRNLYLLRRKADIHISVQKIIQIAKDYKLEGDLSFYDYVLTRLPYDLLESLNGGLNDPFWKDALFHGQEFARRILKKEPHPSIPTADNLSYVNDESRRQIKSLLLWAIRKRKNHQLEFADFTAEFHTFLKDNQIQKIHLFPVMRQLFSQVHGVPLHRLLHFVPVYYLYACVSLLDESE